MTSQFSYAAVSPEFGFARYLLGIIELMSDALIVTNGEGVIFLVNSSAERLIGCDRACVLGAPLRDIIQTVPTRDLAPGFCGEVVLKRSNHPTLSIRISSAPLAESIHGSEATFWIIQDLTVLHTLETQLAQSQKLEAIGSLASGIAHEVNTPIQYVSDNLYYIQRSFADAQRLIEDLEKRLCLALRDGELVCSALEADSDWKFAREEVPKALENSLEGITRVTEIIRAMKEFAHSDEREKVPTEITRSIKSTLAISSNEWKHVAQVHTTISGSIPLVPLFPGEFNQALLNLIINSTDAIRERHGENSSLGVIQITLSATNSHISLSISDNGTGMTDEVKQNLFRRFFTTKKRGKGSGQGLPIVWQSIVERHGGTIEIESKMNVGTTFTLTLPL
jgi:two-component system NtrC family sensor kinase